MLITNEERTNLLDSMADLLDEYDYDYTNKALNAIIDKWSEAKENLIQAFKNHPNYLEGQFMIAFDTDYERAINKQGSIDFSRYLYNACSRPEFISNLPKEIEYKRVVDDCEYLPRDIFMFIGNLSSIACRTMKEETANEINEMMPNVHAHTGEKTSRVINRICTYLGYNKFGDYNREFAKYADSLSPLKITRHTILSLNPLDYLTMSFGNSWASCHTIDKSNKRGMPNSYEGQYSSGTMSYMLDKVSMVFYTVDSSYDGVEYWNEPKINRQMFHYGEEKLIQGRLYPQSNDYEGEDYTPNRNIVQKIIADIYKFPNLWTLKKGTEAACEYVHTHGTHYPDYTHFQKCSLSRQKGSENAEFITIGESPICIECGCTHNVSESINCCHIPNAAFCEHCGCAIMDEEDIYWVDGEAYCRDCVSYCDICGSYHIGTSHYIDRDDVSVCDYCFDEYYVICEDCDEYVHRDDSYWCDDRDGYICDDCYAENYITCEDCGKIVHRHDAYWYEGEQCYICNDCYEENYGTCPKCGEVYLAEDGEEHQDEWICPNCYKELTEEVC